MFNMVARIFLQKLQNRVVTVRLQNDNGAFEGCERLDCFSRIREMMQDASKHYAIVTSGEERTEVINITYLKCYDIADTEFFGFLTSRFDCRFRRIRA